VLLRRFALSLYIHIIDSVQECVGDSGLWACTSPVTCRVQTAFSRLGTGKQGETHDCTEMQAQRQLRLEAGDGGGGGGGGGRDWIVFNG
jgi:hypothetical protein